MWVEVLSTNIGEMVSLVLGCETSTTRRADDGVELVVDRVDFAAIA